MDLVKHPREEALIVHSLNPSPTHGIDASTLDTNHSSPQFKCFSCVKTFSSKLNDYVAHIESFTEPNFTKTMSDSAWCNAMNQEKVAIELNQAWILVDLPIGCYLVSTKWLFKIKHGLEGTPIKYKAHLVAHKFEEQKGVDYQKVFASVTRWMTIRTIITLDVQHD